MSKLKVIDAQDFFASADGGSVAPPPGGTRPPSFEPPSPFDPEGKIAIDVSCEHLPTLNSLCWEAIKQQNDPPVMFLHGTQIVRVSRHPETQKAWLQEVTADILRHELSRWAHWHKDKMKLVKPPIEIIKDVLATKDMPLPVLRRVVSVPVFGQSGKLQTEPGYSKESGLLFMPDRNFTSLPVPDVIKPEDVDAANKLLCEEVLVDFPFSSTADRDNALGLFLLPFARDMIDGPTPCHLIEAPMPSSGKTLLGELLTYPSVQDDIGLITAPTKEEEWAKQITTVLMNAKPVVMIDNLTSTLNSGSLAAAWTARIWDNRILGGHESANVPIKCVWIMTANNAALSTELATRIVRIRIAPQTDRPEERTEFKHFEPRVWVADHRAELVQAAHVMIQWWLQNGSPPPKSKPLSRYPTWSKVIGGILETCGYTQFLANYRDFQGRSDVGRMARSTFCVTWYEWSQMPEFAEGRKRVTATELLPIAEGVEGFPLFGDTLRKQATSLGRWLGSQTDYLVGHEEEVEDGEPLKRVFRIKKWPTLIGGKQYWTITLVS